MQIVGRYNIGERSSKISQNPKTAYSNFFLLLLLLLLLRGYFFSGRTHACYTIRFSARIAVHLLVCFYFATKADDNTK